MEFPAFSDLAVKTFCVMETSAANEGLFLNDDHVMNSRRANLKEFLSERHTLFQQCSEKEALKVDNIFLLYSIFQELLLALK